MSVQVGTNIKKNYLPVFEEYPDVTGFFSLKDGAVEGSPYNNPEMFRQLGLEDAVRVWPTQIHKTQVAVIRQEDVDAARAAAETGYSLVLGGSAPDAGETKNHTQANPDPSAQSPGNCSTAIIIPDTDGTITKQLIDDLPHDRTFTLAELPQLLLTQPNAWSRCWKRSLFLDTGIRYPSRVWYEDIRTTTKLFAAAGSICAVPDVFYYYVVREGSITRNPNVARNAEILDAFDDLLGWYRSSGLFAQYYNELSRLTVDHVLLAGSVRVLRIDPDSELLGRFQDYVQTQFPDYLDNPLLAQLSRSHKLILRLLRQRKYRTVRALFAAKDKLG